MKLIVGLGNPGLRYAQTRHNVGFMVIDQLLRSWPPQKEQEKFAGLFSKAHLEDHPVGLLKPTTSMNLSGISVGQAMKFYRLDLDQLLVIADDLALPPGRLRIRRSGSSGGHNGLASVSQHLGSDSFARLRIGIGPSDLPDSADYVLAKCSDEQWPSISAAIDKAVQAVSCWVLEGSDAAMNRFNAPDDPQNNGGL
ncbi:MAG: aminoacyl-tRNA hydrolase [Actinobacteria bacterium]|nr:aminoacyl-tRNA hydrolase [Actinomycetota bacterium]